MSDIVQRLRELSMLYPHSLVREAADEIERLRLRRDGDKKLLVECRHFVKAMCDHDDTECECYQHIILRAIDASVATDPP